MKIAVFLFLAFLPSMLVADVSGIHHPPTHIIPQGATDFYGFFYQIAITGTNTTTNNNDGTVSVACSGGGQTFFLLLEDGTDVLLEDGNKVLIE